MNTGILIICHRQLATYLKETTFCIIGEQENFETIEVLPQDGVEGTQQKISKILEKWTDIENILVFVDIFGGTPCNASAKLFREKKITVDIISGVNLPMILTAITKRNSVKDFVSLTNIIIEEAKKNVISLKQLNLI